MGNDVDYAAEFYEGDFEYGENTIFRWYNKDYWYDEESNLPRDGHEYDRRILNKSIKESPIVTSPFLIDLTSVPISTTPASNSWSIENS
jgi:hypothetical protein